MTTNVELGRFGESLATHYFERLGCEILDQNWRCSFGEIDLVVRDGAYTACVEVKTRRSLRAGHPLEAITPEKLRRMRLVAGQWSAANPQHARRLRLDVISVVVSGVREPELMHLEGVG